MKRLRTAGLLALLTLILALPTAVQAACDRQAFAKTVSLAGKGDVTAMLRLARHHGEGECVVASKRWEANWVRYAAAGGDSGALAWLLREADARNPAALFNLGLMYRMGIVFKRDYAKALARYRQAAAFDYPLALHWVGEMHMQGLGVPKNDQQALRWFTASARLGWAYSHYKLCGLYKDGRGVKKNPQMAVRHCTQAAEKKQTDAMVQLAEFYTTGFGVSKDPRKAHNLAERAYGVKKNTKTAMLIADYARIGVYGKPRWDRSRNFYAKLNNSNARGLFLRAEMHQKGGYGLRQDKNRARLLYQQAAKLGHTGARIALAARYPSKTKTSGKRAAPPKDECKNAANYFECRSKKSQEMTDAFKSALDEMAKSPLSFDEQMRRARAEKRAKQK
ncbi:MAG: tetratricopeptide repeat protein [Alphaproteobacteria bacterium]